jgi:hypothetical protein
MPETERRAVMKNFFEEYAHAAITLDDLARRVAERAGFLAIGGDTIGEFMLVDPITGRRVVAGEGFDMSAEEVIEYCHRPAA